MWLSGWLQPSLLSWLYSKGIPSERNFFSTVLPLSWVRDDCLQDVRSETVELLGVSLWYLYNAAHFQIFCLKIVLRKPQNSNQASPRAGEEGLRDVPGSGGPQHSISPVASPLCALNTEKREDACVFRKTANSLIFLVIPFVPSLAYAMTYSTSRAGG